MTALAALGRHQPEQEDHRLAREQQQDQRQAQEREAHRDRPLPGHRERRQETDTRRSPSWNRKHRGPGRAPLERLALVLDGPRCARRLGGGHGPHSTAGRRFGAARRATGSPRHDARAAAPAAAGWPYHQRRWTTPATPSHRSAGTPSPSSSASATPRPPARRCSVPERMTGAPPLSGSSTRLCAARWASPWATRSSVTATRRRRRPRTPAPQDPFPAADNLDEFRSSRAPHAQPRYHPRALTTSTPPPQVAPLREVLAQWTNQGRGRVARRAVRRVREEEVVRWLSTSSATARPASACLLGRRDGQLHRDGAVPRRPSPRHQRTKGRRAAPPRLARSTPATDPLLDRPRARRAGHPARDAV